MGEITREWYDCASCGKRWKIESFRISCGVLHAPGRCCHYGETELLKSEVVAGATEISRLHHRLAEAVALLKELEFDLSGDCSICSGHGPTHKPTCALAKILREHE